MPIFEKLMLDSRYAKDKPLDKVKLRTQSGAFRRAQVRDYHNVCRLLCFAKITYIENGALKTSQQKRSMRW